MASSSAFFILTLLVISSCAVEDKIWKREVASEQTTEASTDWFSSIGNWFNFPSLTDVFSSDNGESGSESERNKTISNNTTFTHSPKIDKHNSTGLQLLLPSNVINKIGSQFNSAFDGLNASLSGIGQCRKPLECKPSVQCAPHFQLEEVVSELSDGFNNNFLMSDDFPQPCIFPGVEFFGACCPVSGRTDRTPSKIIPFYRPIAASMHRVCQLFARAAVTQFNSLQHLQHSLDHLQLPTNDVLDKLIFGNNVLNIGDDNEKPDRLFTSDIAEFLNKSVHSILSLPNLDSVLNFNSSKKNSSLHPINGEADSENSLVDDHKNFRKVVVKGGQDLKSIVNDAMEIGEQFFDRVTRSALQDASNWASKLSIFDGFSCSKNASSDGKVFADNFWDSRLDGNASDYVWNCEFQTSSVTTGSENNNFWKGDQQWRFVRQVSDEDEATAASDPRLSPDHRPRGSEDQQSVITSTGRKAFRLGFSGIVLARTTKLVAKR